MAILILDNNKRSAAETAKKIAEQTGGKIIYSRKGQSLRHIRPKPANDQDYYGGDAA